MTHYSTVVSFKQAVVRAIDSPSRLAIQRLGKEKPRRALLAMSWLGVAVSLWIFTEASPEELIWAGAALVVGAALVMLTARSSPKPAAGVE